MTDEAVRVPAGLGGLSEEQRRNLGMARLEELRQRRGDDPTVRSFALGDRTRLLDIITTLQAALVAYEADGISLTARNWQLAWERVYAIAQQQRDALVAREGELAEHVEIIAAFRSREGQLRHDLAAADVKLEAAESKLRAVEALWKRLNPQMAWALTNHDWLPIIVNEWREIMAGFRATTTASEEGP